MSSTSWPPELKYLLVASLVGLASTLLYVALALSASPEPPLTTPGAAAYANGVVRVRGLVSKDSCGYRIVGEDGTSILLAPMQGVSLGQDYYEVWGVPGTVTCHGSEQEALGVFKAVVLKG